jgi:glutamyl-tRNA reductase
VTNLESEELPEFHVLQAGVDVVTHPLDMLNRLRPPASVDEIPRKVCGSSLAELMLLVTCHRVELYAATVDLSQAQSELHTIFEAMHDGSVALCPKPIFRRNAEAARHLIRVAAGLDSARLGEHEVLGQVRRMHADGMANTMVGPVLERLYAQSMNAARNIRNELGVTYQNPSLTATAVKWIQSGLTDPQRRSAVVVGAGEAAAQVVRHLVAMGIGRLTVANRTLAHAQRLANEFGSDASPLEQLPDLAAEADVIVCAVSARFPILLLDHLRHTKGDRIVIDLGVPRNTDTAIDALANVQVLDMEKLTAIELINCDAQRKEFTTRVSAQVNIEADKFVDWCRTRSITPMLVDLRAHFESTIQREAMQSLGEIAHHSTGDVERFASRLSDKLLHNFYLGLKEIAIQHSPHHARRITRALVLRDDANTVVRDGDSYESRLAERGIAVRTKQRADC